MQNVSSPVRYFFNRTANKLNVVSLPSFSNDWLLNKWKSKNYKRDKPKLIKKYQVWIKEFKDTSILVTKHLLQFPNICGNQQLYR